MTTTSTLPANAPVALRALWAPMVAGDLSIQDIRTALCAVMSVDHTSSTIRVVDHVVRIDYDYRVEYFQWALERVCPLGLSIAPELIATYVSSDRAVAVARYNAVPGESLIPVLEYDGPIPDEAKQRFRDDIVRLFDAGLNHPSTTRDPTHWLISEHTRTLVMENWDAFEDKPPRNLEDKLENLDDFLELVPW